MRTYRRAFVTLGLAATLPVLTFSAVEIYLSLKERRAAVERSAVARVDRVVAEVDARLRAEFAALRVLASSSSFQSDDWSGFYERAARSKSLTPAWVTVGLYDALSDTWIFDLRSPFAAAVPLEVAPPAPPQQALAGRPSAGGAERMAAPPPAAVAWLYLPVLRADRVVYVLALALDSEVFQRILMDDVPAEVVGAIVDHEGRFLARTLAYDERAGTPATRFVRNAMAASERGFYRGTTYEGFENYTAFRNSPLSGWSTHVAVASGLIDAPAMWSTVAAWLAALGALIVVGALGLLVARDLAERRNAERTMMESQKMEAVGRLTGGIAHDFNNLLTAIIGNVGLLRRRLGGQPELERLAALALEAANRAAKLSSQLLAFSRTQRLELKPVDLDALFTGMRDLLAQTLGPAVALRIAIDPAATRVVSDRNQLELAILNLAANARDATPGGGQLEIATRPATRADVREGVPDDFVVITVADDGCGMSEDVRSRALEPFYTTKPLGKGTGLGLAQVYGIVTESGGSVHIDSEQGKGTRVHLVLPAARSTPVSEREDLSQTGADRVVAADRSASILVVDDDAGVRAFLATALRSDGHRVLEEGTPEAALEQLSMRAVDLLIVDYLMPQMTGAELVQHVRARWPTLPVLMISGHHDTAAVSAAAGTMRLLRKPFDAAELTRVVAELLCERG